MRILLGCAPPWAHSGYGAQAALMARALRSLGHDVGLSVYAGVHQEGEWEGFPVLGTGGKSFGNGVYPVNYRRFAADLLITLCDPWVLDPNQFKDMRVMPWMPVDCDPLSVMEHRFLQRLQQIADVHPVAMSEFGARVLAEKGFPAPVVPHALQDCFTPAVDPSGFRRELKIPPGAFLIVKCGVNNSDDRKAFEVTLQAFAASLAKRNAVLYLHCEPQAKDAPNLVMMALTLGLKGKVAFADQDRRAADLYPAEWMASMYAAADVTDVCSKSEGFGVCTIESLACGTPVIGCRNSATTEKVKPAWGWLVGGQKTWPRHHHSWWVTPSVRELAHAYTQAYSSAKGKRAAAAAEGARWGLDRMTEAWRKALAGL